ncbi:hypothetical protein HY489_00865 [Candidatus Woesearchaeota archaeon]|nr:hypothetical protein [Candidatus Woesearchaeota archaeon]
MKRGQITIFIILGIILLIAIGIATYLYTREEERPFQITERFETIDPTTLEKYIESCITSVGIEGVYLLAQQGGYLNPKGDDKYADFGDGLQRHYYTDVGVVPYVGNKNDTALQTIEQMDTLLERYILVNLPSCLDFTQAQGLRVTQPEIDWQAENFTPTKVDHAPERVMVQARIRPDTHDILLQAYYPILFESKESSFLLADFTSILPLRLSLLHKIANRLTAQIAINDLTGLTYKIEEHCKEYAPADKMINLYADTSAFAEESLIGIVDAQPVSKGLAPLRFQFAVRNANVQGVCIG